MIRITRDPEPEALSRARAAGLERVRSLLAVDPDRRLTGEEWRGYQEAARPLWRAQGEKCCYCETKIEQPYSDTEHYRPKVPYWWLAWTWENLLFACPNCNRSGKRSQFPLADDSTRLQPEEEPPGQEVPLLLDPAGGADPLDSIEFRCHRVNRETRWIPVGKDPRGQMTIEVLGLDRDALIERYTEHVNLNLRPRLGSLRQALQRQDERAIHAEWSSLLRSYLAVRSPFSALSHDAIAALVQEEERQRWCLELDRPPFTRGRRSG